MTAAPLLPMSRAEWGFYGRRFSRRFLTCCFYIVRFRTDTFWKLLKTDWVTTRSTKSSLQVQNMAVSIRSFFEFHPRCVFYATGRKRGASGRRVRDTEDPGKCGLNNFNVRDHKLGWSHRSPAVACHNGRRGGINAT